MEKLPVLILLYGISKMKAVESRAEVYLMALQSLSTAEREAVIARLLEDTQLREDILDIALMQQRQGEPSRPFRDYLAERGK
jgi:galactose-1-phosphate uridylyltransferase